MMNTIQEIKREIWEEKSDKKMMISFTNVELEDYIFLSSAAIQTEYPDFITEKLTFVNGLQLEIMV